MQPVGRTCVLCGKWSTFEAFLPKEVTSLFMGDPMKYCIACISDSKTPGNGLKPSAYLYAIKEDRLLQCEKCCSKKADICLVRESNKGDWSPAPGGWINKDKRTCSVCGSCFCYFWTNKSGTLPEITKDPEEVRPDPLYVRCIVNLTKYSPSQDSSDHTSTFNHCVYCGCCIKKGDLRCYSCWDVDEYGSERTCTSFLVTDRTEIQICSVCSTWCPCTMVNVMCCFTKKFICPGCISRYYETTSETRHIFLKVSISKLEKNANKNN